MACENARRGDVNAPGLNAEMLKKSAEAVVETVTEKLLNANLWIEETSG